MKKSALETTGLDHFLVILACAAALWALGESLTRHGLATFITVGAVVSLLIGYGLSKVLKGTKIISYDSYIWSGLAVLTALASPFLNSLLPDEGFPFMLFAGSWLSWMVILCGLVSWRDQTLLFLNIPCLSIFALVGTFDTYPFATVLFFLFLICSSLLYARIHKRSMVRRAQSAGVENPELLERDAWRWMAGPEWAMASAGLIVLVSLVVGPILRFSLQNVSGSVKVVVPAAPTPAASNKQVFASDQMVGRGQFTEDETPVFKIKVPYTSHLRQSFFTDYAGNGWNRLRLNDDTGQLDLNSRIRSWPADKNHEGVLSAWPTGSPLEPMTQFSVQTGVFQAVEDALTFLPTPGPVTDVKTSGQGNFAFTAAGNVFKRGGISLHETITFHYRKPVGKPGRALLPESMRPISKHFYGVDRATNRTVDFAKSLVVGIESDYDKAEAIRKGISERAGYTLKPKPISISGDSVDQFLFETREGYCDLFATSMAVCARAVGLPSRYAVGFAMGEDAPDVDGFTTVREKNAHAWAEIYFEGQGWIPFDATEGARLLDAKVDKNQGPWYQQLPIWLAIGFGVLALSLLVYFGWKAIAASRESAGLGQTIDDSALALHSSFDRILSKRTGVRRRFSQTTSEYVTFVSDKLGDSSPIAQQLVPLLEAACFGPLKTRTEAINDAKHLMHELKRTKGKSPDL